MDRRSFPKYSMVGAVGAAAALYSLNGLNVIKLSTLTDFIQKNQVAGEMGESSAILDIIGLLLFRATYQDYRSPA